MRRRQLQLNSGKAILAEVQALLTLAPPLPDDAIVESHGSIPGSQQDAETITAAIADATPGSHGADDGHTSYPRALRETLGEEVEHRCNQYLNNRLE